MTENPKSLRVFDGAVAKVQIQWEPRDVWIGLFWRHTDVCWHFYICVLPLVPIHVTVLRKEHR